MSLSTPIKCPISVFLPLGGETHPSPSWQGCGTHPGSVNPGGEQIGLAEMFIVFQPERPFELLPGHLSGKN